MRIIYIQTGDDLPIAAANPVVYDESDSWYGGTQLCFASLALATASLLSAGMTASAVQAYSWHQDDPALQGATQEEYWQNPVAPVPLSFYVKLPFLDPEEIPAGTLTATVDEYYWQNPVPPVPATLYQKLPYLPDPDEIPANKLFGNYDEVYWQNPVAPVPASFLPFTPWVDEQTPTLFGQYDEDFWLNPVAPVPASFLPLNQWTFDEQTPALSATVDEYFWFNPVPPVWSYSVPPAFSYDEVIVPQAVSFTPEEDYWRNPVLPVQALNILTPQWIYDMDFVGSAPPAAAAIGMKLYIGMRGVMTQGDMGDPVVGGSGE